jgi:hypothetical protein
MIRGVFPIRLPRAPVRRAGPGRRCATVDMTAAAGMR